MITKIKILLVDDHMLVRQALKSLLSVDKDLVVIGEAECGEEAIQKAGNLKPHIIVMDLHMDGIGGVEATRIIQYRYPNVKTLILTSSEETAYFSWLLNLGGIAGYLTKGSSVEEIITAIRNINSGKNYIGRIFSQQMVLEEKNDEHFTLIKQLTMRELQIVFMLVSCQKVAQIAKKLHISSKCVNTHRYNIFSKLNIHSDVELVYLAIRQGLVENSQYNQCLI